jgi:lactate dehydrogenase-like 2-hydroxyacid dehydrogenase
LQIRRIQLPADLNREAVKLHQVLGQSVLRAATSRSEVLFFLREIRGPFTMKIAFLGLGKMGVPMARRLLAAGHDVTVWNRTRERADALAAQGAIVASSPAEAARSAEAVLTMLFDDAANEAVLFGP